MTVELGTGLAFALAAGLVLLAWPYARHVVTLVHEAGHAGVAVLTGRRLQSVTLHSDTSGLTTTRGRPRGAGMIATAAAGYLAPAAAGLALAWAVGLGHTEIALVATLVLLVLLLLWIRNWFGLLVVVASGAAVALLIWRTDEVVQEFAATAAAAFLVLGAPRPTFELWVTRRRRASRSTDADLLARITWVPAAVWCVLFTVTTTAAAVVGSSLLLLGRPWP